MFLHYTRYKQRWTHAPIRDFLTSVKDVGPFHVTGDPLDNTPFPSVKPHHRVEFLGRVGMSDCSDGWSRHEGQRLSALNLMSACSGAFTYTITLTKTDHNW
jgi:hypothetical protein